jgi:thioredoxin reductase (NADPH)
MKKKVKYYNRLGRVVDKNTVELKDKDGNIETITSRFIVIAVGGRPYIPDNIDRSLVITSDDLFSIDKPPKKTLVVGASYVALECAGFIQSI